MKLTDGLFHEVFDQVAAEYPDVGSDHLIIDIGTARAAAKMLAHLGEGEHAELIHDAWLRTIEDGLHEADVKKSLNHGRVVGTDAFADAVIGRLGPEPFTAGQVIDLLLKLSTAGIEFVKTENLYNFDGKPGYSMGQGQ